LLQNNYCISWQRILKMSPSHRVMTSSVLAPHSGQRFQVFSPFGQYVKGAKVHSTSTVSDILDAIYSPFSTICYSFVHACHGVVGNGSVKVYDADKGYTGGPKEREQLC